MRPRRFTTVPSWHEATCKQAPAGHVCASDGAEGRQAWQAFWPPKSPVLQIHAEETAVGVALGLQFLNPSERLRQVAGGNIEIEFRAHRL